MINASAESTYISRRPAWADEVLMDESAITYCWTAPTEAVDDPESDAVRKIAGEPCKAPVQITQEHYLDEDDQGIRITPGRSRIFLLDTNFDVENARKLAAAILECCDRLDVTEAGR